MLLKDDKKRAVTIISGKLGPAAEKPMNEMGDEVETDAGLNAASEEIISAIEQKNVSALKAALKSFIEMCEYEEDSAEEQE